jgi:glutaconate CoA-transferase subunit B
VKDYTLEELLAVTVARLIADASHVAVGAASPIPATAATLVRAKQIARGYPPLRLTLLQRRHGNPFSDGTRELFDLAGQGRIDVFFLGGAQIDGEANINLVGTGFYPATERRFPGSFGSAFMYFAARRTILFREEHSARVLVPKVDFISAPGWSPPGIWRRGGPQALVTGKAVFRWIPERKHFQLASVHPGLTTDEIRATTGFDFDCPRDVPETPAPGANDIALLRGPVALEIAADYPQFARRVWGTSSPTSHAVESATRPAT